MPYAPTHVEKPTTRLFVPIMTDLTRCYKHSTVKGEPCWTIETSGGLSLPAICNERVKNAANIVQIPTTNKPMTERRKRSRGRYQRKTRSLEAGLSE